ncbi:MAG: LytR C-terminal domain-containing protein [Actinomycetota bacterium]
MANQSRFLIVAALIVGGILLLGNAFESPQVAASIPSPTPSPVKEKKDKDKAEQPSGDTGQTGGTGTAQDTDPDITGLRVAVFNATSEDGLAGEVDVKLTSGPWNSEQAMQPGDSDESLDVSALYYDEEADQAAAEYIARRVLKVDDAVIEPIAKAPGVSIGGVPTDISKDVQVAVFVGADYLS